MRVLEVPRRSTDLRTTIVSSLVWLAGLAVVAAVVTLGLGLHRGDPEGAARVANAEIEAMLEKTERVIGRVGVSQRLWWDYYRHTWGVLAATDRRLLFVGVPPEPFLHGDDGPPELVTQSFPYARGLAIERVSLFRGRSPGVRIITSSGSEEFGYARRDRKKLDDALGVVERAETTLRAAADAERRAAEAAVAASRRPIYHLVQRGEALEVIARRYGVPAESLAAWNRLTNARITVGQRLLVRPGQDQ